MKDALEHFKNEILHEAKRCGDMNFVNHVVSKGLVDILWNNQQYEEALYLLAIVDYFSREHNCPLCRDYRELRKQKLQDLIFPNSILMMDKLQPSYGWKKKAIENAIPEFLRHNIVEGDVKNAI